ncbi:MAG TPA: alpha-2-macroglobulin, partial [Chitinophagales bacterium]|nr:alpha-2-macroglobulin [Chitinophagales bacterium]
LGMYWKANESGGWHWYQAPVETQALLIEAFHEVARDEKSVDEMKVWLLKQKQTTAWKSTKATAEACYALLLQGTNWAKSDNLVEVSLNKIKVEPQKMDATIEPGTGYYKVKWSGDAIKPEMGKIEIKKTDKGPAWGAMYWQYFEDLDKITSAETNLKLNKKLFKKVQTASGVQLQEITPQTPLNPGDLVTVRIELRTDRNMEYVHLKDMRAAGFEPVNVLSQYKWQDGLGYYESTKDVATHFFMDWMNKGIYVFEYDVRATLAGNFSNGITSIECMYAPEFTSHSKGERVTIVKK